jgi:DNA-binding MarR family transcriptional regulator
MTSANQALMTISKSASRNKTADTQAWLSVARAYHLCDVALAARMAEMGLRVGEHEVLAHVYHSPGLTQQTLAQRCFVAKSGISMLLTRMEAQGLLIRESDTKDGRIKRLALSASGESLARQSLAIQDTIVAHMMATLSPSEVQAMTQLSQRVSAQLEDLMGRQT